MHYVLPRHLLLTIYKSIIRPRLDYGDIIYGQPNDQAFSNKLEAVEYNAALAITGAIRGTSKAKMNQELRLESLKSRRWFRRPCYFYKIKNYGLPEYLLKLIPVDTYSYNTRISENNTTYHCRTDSLRLGLSHLNEHRFNHNFENCINPLCTCTLEIESTTHFFLHCHFYRNIRKTLLDDLYEININISNFSETALTDVLLYGKSSFDKIQNKKILTRPIKYILESEKFTGSIF